MKKVNNSRAQYLEELEKLVSGSFNEEELRECLSDYHDNDIAELLEHLTLDKRQYICSVIGVERVAEIIAYFSDAEEFVQELSPEKAADLISHMDSDDAAEILEDIEESRKEEIVRCLDKGISEDVKLLWSYEENEIGSSMTTNYICIQKNLTIRQAMRELVRQAGENDNISTIYVVDENEIYYGAINLKDLIVARENEELETLISRSFPYVLDYEKIDECIERIRGYAEDSLPVLTREGKIAGIITSPDVVELVDEAMSEDYAKFAGLTAEEDLKETAIESMKKRLPWLTALLFLGMAVSSVVGVFESVAAVLPVIVCFQSLILDMAGNVGTQSLAVTIRVLMDENLKTKQKLTLVCKEARIGLANGSVLCIITLLVIGPYVHFFKNYGWQQSFLIAACVGAALIAAMLISSIIGTVIPIFFHKIKVDPAIASGPLITTINDLVAVVTYYGLASVVLTKLL